MSPAARYRVLILGHGEIGRAMEFLLAPRHELMIWQRRAPIDLEAAAMRCDVVLFCLPAAPHYELACRLAPALAREAVCLSVAKGLDDAGRTAAQALGEALAGRCAYGVLHGPMIAEEILAGKPAFAACASRSRETFALAERLFAGSALALAYTPDIVGAAWCAVLKNVYAILFGVADGLDLGDNLRGYLTVAVVQELVALVARLGGAPATAYSLAGLGDLVTTATSAGSHHHELGRRIARGERALSGEGVHTLHTLQARRLFALDDYPLLQQVARLVTEPERARALLAAHLEHWRARQDYAGEQPR